jgi:hypothetical protein
MVQLSSNEIQYGPAPAAIPMGGRARSATRQGGKETRPMRHRNVVAVAVVVAVTAVAAAAAPPTPRARHTPTPRRPTGYDIAVVNIRTTGPNGSVANAILPTFKNLGTKTIDRTLQFYYWVNGWGGDPYSASIAFSLAPGQTFVYQPNPLEAGFVKYGDTVRVFIDPKNKLAEDNESNNSMTKLLVAPAVMPRH